MASLRELRTTRSCHHALAVAAMFVCLSGGASAQQPQPAPADAASVYNDDRTDLDHRVQRFESGLAWNEDPPARVRRMVTNIDAEPSDIPDELAVYSNIVLYRNRREDEEGWFVAARRDRLRVTDAGLRLARRHIVLDHNVILDENLSVFL